MCSDKSGACLACAVQQPARCKPGVMVLCKYARGCGLPKVCLQTSPQFSGLLEGCGSGLNLVQGGGRGSLEMAEPKTAAAKHGGLFISS